MKSFKLKLLPTDEQNVLLNEVFCKWASLCTRMASKGHDKERLAPPDSSGNYFNKTQLNQVNTDVTDHKGALEESASQKERAVEKVKRRLKLISDMLSEPKLRDVSQQKPTTFRPLEWVKEGLLKTKYHTVHYWQKECDKLTKQKERMEKTIEKIKKGKITFKPTKMSLHQNCFSLSFGKGKFSMRPFSDTKRGINLDMLTAPIQPAIGKNDGKSSLRSKEFIARNIENYIIFSIHSQLFGLSRSEELLLNAKKEELVAKRDAMLKKKSDSLSKKIKELEKIVGRKLTDSERSEVMSQGGKLSSEKFSEDDSYLKTLKVLAKDIIGREELFRLKKYPIVIRKPLNERKKLKNLKPDEWEYYLQLSYDELEKKEFTPKTIMGIDRGLKHILAIAIYDSVQNKFVKNMLIPNPILGWKWKLRKIKRSIQHMERRIRAQQNAHIPENQLKKRLKSIENKIDYYYHNVSRQILNLAHDFKSAIVVEDLQNMKQHGRKKSKGLRGLNYALSNFDYGKIMGLVKYKAESENVPLLTVLPAGTSQNCAYCLLYGKEQGNYVRNNVNSKIGKCKLHGEIDADINAARTIAICYHKNINEPKPYGERKTFKRK